jgi:hypothetical protein
VLYSNNNRNSTKSIYIDIRFLVVKERIQSVQISIEHIGTDSIITDRSTKDLSPKVFYEYTTHMGVMLFQHTSV